MINITARKTTAPASSAPQEQSKTYQPQSAYVRRAAILNGLASAAEAQIKEMLKDPASAEFKDSEARIRHGERIACGYVNSKNSFGAMAGYTGWVVRFDERKSLLETSFGDNVEFAHTWNRFCTGPQDPIDEDVSAQHVSNVAIKASGFSCGRLQSAEYASDGSVKAICSNGEDFRIADMGWKYVAIRCSAARKYRIQGC